GQHRYGGLADRHDMAARTEQVEEVANVIDVVVKFERTLAQRHVAGIPPVGDVDLMVGQHGLHRAAQQSGEMARQGRHDQQLRIPALLAAFADEMLELPEGQAQHDLLAHPAGRAVDHRGFEAEFRLGVASGAVVEGLQPGCHGTGGRRVVQRQIGKPQRRGLNFGQRANRLQRDTLHLVKGIDQHGHPSCRYRTRPRDAAPEQNPGTKRRKWLVSIRWLSICNTMLSQPHNPFCVAKRKRVPKVAQDLSPPPAGRTAIRRPAAEGNAESGTPMYSPLWSMVTPLLSFLRLCSDNPKLICAYLCLFVLIWC